MELETYASVQLMHLGRVGLSLDDRIGSSPSQVGALQLVMYKVRGYIIAVLG